jgi:hypothetical protein
VENGELREKLEYEEHSAFDFERPNLLGQNYWAYSAVDLECIDNAQREQLKAIGYTWNETARFMAYRVSVVNGTIAMPQYSADLSTCWAPDCEF